MAAKKRTPRPPASKGAKADNRTRWERLFDAASPVRRIFEEEELGHGYKVDAEPLIVRRLLDLLVDNAGLRWREKTEDGRYTAAHAGKNYALPSALLHLAIEALENEGKRPTREIASETAAIVRGVTDAYEEGDMHALTRGLTTRGRDAPTNWAANYGRRRGKNPRRLDRVETIDRLIQSFDQRYFIPKRTGDDIVHAMVTDAIMSQCIEPVDHDEPAGLFERVQKSFAKKWPDDAFDAVDRLLRLSGQRDPMNALNKQLKRPKR